MCPDGAWKIAEKTTQEAPRQAAAETPSSLFILRAPYYSYGFLIIVVGSLL